MQYIKRRLLPLKRLGQSDFDFEREVTALSSALIASSEVEADITQIVSELADGEDHMLDWYAIIDDERIPLHELDDCGEYDMTEDLPVIYVLDDQDLIVVLERYILRKKEMQSFESIKKLFDIQRFVAVEVLYKTFYNYVLIERIDTAKQIINEFFDGI